MDEKSDLHGARGHVGGACSGSDVPHAPSRARPEGCPWLLWKPPALTAEGLRTVLKLRGLWA